ncbi:MAG: T9SS type A sorting domain-containing protein [Ignavibacteria bacterium]|nr:T9SS type A sorting domain-containing protein [Ignavibacteria bacterium]
MYLIKRILLHILLFFFLSFSSFSKLEIVKDSRGTDFWLTFLPNYHRNWDSNFPWQKYGDSLYIFLAATEPTKGKIEYYSRDGKFFNNEFEIQNPNSMYIFKIPSYDYELIGCNVSEKFYDTPNPIVQTETVAINSFHITSEKEVSAYALNQANKTSDAFLVLPTDVLGNRYFILSYQSDGVSDDSSQTTPSQFAIVAIEDNTNITIYPKTATYRYGTQTQKIVLNKGEVYLVQAKVTPKNLNTDLTGTEIVSSKPIAVFSGHQRATVPISIRPYVNNPSRDILIEQLPPVSTWGKNSIVVPFAKSRREITNGESIFRVLAAEDGTEIYLNGTRVRTLNQGEFYEGVLNKPYFVSSNKPILVGAYKKTCGSGFNYLGDPFFAIMPPVEQYLDEYRVLNAQAAEVDKAIVYLEQYITVIIPKVSWQSFRIDGAALSLRDIIDVPGSQYVYANIKVSDGVHYLSADTTFGVVIYGYGNANSYGYIGGSNFLRLNFLEPQITTLNTDSCFVSKGIAYKKRPQDAPLSKFVVIDSLLLNCELSYFLNKQDTIFFDFRLKDNFQDGRYAVFVSDTMNLGSQVLDVWIPGFTFGIENQPQNVFKEIKAEIATGKDFCFKVPIINYGNLSKVLTSAYLKNTKILPKNFQPTRLNSGERVELLFCFTSNIDTTIVDTLIIENNCFGKKVLAIEITFSTDKEPPKYQILKDSCSKFYEIIVFDSLNSDKGLKKVSIVQQVNCEANILENYPQFVRIQIRIIDFKQDSYIGVSALDSAGNKIELWDTIPGFTLKVASDIEVPINVGKYYIGHIVCKDFPLYNYGNFPIIIDRAYFINNIEFSIIPSNFPIIVPPKTIFPLTFCFNPTTVGNTWDTLVVEYDKFCVLWDFPFFGEGKEILLESQSKCNVTVTSKITKVNNLSKKVNLYPNPGTEIIYLEPKENSEFLELEIFDLYGKILLHNFFKIENNSILEINISALVQGVYYIRVSDRQGNIEHFLFQKL